MAQNSILIMLKRIWKLFWGWLTLVACAWIVVWHSFRVLTHCRHNRLSRSMVNQHLKQGAQQILKLINASYEVHFSADFKRQPNTPYILMANHLSLFDLPLLFSALPGAMRFLVKQSLFKLPVFGKAIHAAEFLPVHIEDPHKMGALLETAKNKLKDGMMLCIFPEGRRSLTGQLLPFRPGGFRLAREIGAHIIPVGITGTNQALPARTASLKRGQHFTLNIGTPIDTTPFKTPKSQHSLIRVVEQAIRNLCQQRYPS